MSMMSNALKKIIELTEENEQLKHRLSNCIEPKFKVGDKVWYIENEKKSIIKSFKVATIKGLYFRYCDEDGTWLHEDELFATEEEAKAKLRERKK